MGFGGGGFLYLGELSLQLVIDVVEGAAKVSELFAGLIGDEELSHAVPIDRLGRLRGHLRHLLHPVPAHPRAPPPTLLFPKAKAPLLSLPSLFVPIADGARRKTMGWRPSRPQGITLNVGFLMIERSEMDHQHSQSPSIRSYKSPSAQPNVCTRSSTIAIM